MVCTANALNKYFVLKVKFYSIGKCMYRALRFDFSSQSCEILMSEYKTVNGLCLLNITSITVMKN